MIASRGHARFEAFRRVLRELRVGIEGTKGGRGHTAQMV